MIDALAEKDTYTRYGIALSPEATELKIDLSNPVAFLVHGINERTGESKSYLLKVTQQGRLILQ